MEYVENLNCKATGFIIEFRESPRDFHSCAKSTSPFSAQGSRQITDDTWQVNKLFFQLSVLSQVIIWSDEMWPGMRHSYVGHLWMIYSPVCERVTSRVETWPEWTTCGMFRMLALWPCDCNWSPLNPIATFPDLDTHNRADASISFTIISVLGT